MLDSQGQSRGFGFVAFSTPENATKAVKEMNGKMIGKKPLYVAVAQSKEERKAILEARPCFRVQASSGTCVLRFAFIISFGFYPWPSKNLYFLPSGTPQQQLHQARPAQVQASGMAHTSSGLHLSYPLAPTLGPQTPYFCQGYSDLVPLEPAGCGYEQQLVFGNLPNGGFKVYDSDHLWSEGQPRLPVGVNRSGIPQLQLLQM
ncbi:hypothetical protein IFM89_011388 [Coptis chinensis]|uniref:RRM domain-containing protein n=1 Tax=Coptis chinensis TaxID=261450 RepID=A0A835LXL8_9MAGN|nr:hypothetical protein IFM89_011388 [Coptis chinensis]